MDHSCPSSHQTGFVRSSHAVLSRLQGELATRSSTPNDADTARQCLPSSSQALTAAGAFCVVCAGPVAEILVRAVLTAVPIILAHRSDAAGKRALAQLLLCLTAIIPCEPFLQKARRDPDFRQHCVQLWQHCFCNEDGGPGARHLATTIFEQYHLPKDEGLVTGLLNQELSFPVGLVLALLGEGKAQSDLSHCVHFLCHVGKAFNGHAQSLPRPLLRVGLPYLRYIRSTSGNNSPFGVEIRQSCLISLTTIINDHYASFLDMLSDGLLETLFVISWQSEQFWETAEAVLNSTFSLSIHPEVIVRLAKAMRRVTAKKGLLTRHGQNSPLTAAWEEMLAIVNDRERAFKQMYSQCDNRKV